MSSSIEYLSRVVPCPKCKEKNEVTVTREQSNVTLNLYDSYPKDVACDNCGKKLSKKYIKETIYAGSTQ